MNKLIILLFLLPIVTATSIYSGETFILDVSETYDFYSIVGNTTPIYLEVTQIGTQVYITPDKYSIEDNFEIIFFNKEKEVITIYSGGGGGGGSSTKTIYKDKNVTVTVPVEVIKEVEVEKEIEKEIEVEIETNKIPVWIWIVLIFLTLFLLILYMWKSNSKENTDERRYKDEQENTGI